MASKLLSPDEARALLAKRYAAHHRSWSIGDGTWPLSIALGSPTEREASEHTGSVRAWIEAWQSFEQPDCVSWEEVRWRRLGQQRLPVRLLLTSAAVVAQLIGEDVPFSRAAARYRTLSERFPALHGSSTVARHFGTLAELSEEDFARLLSLLAWLLANPASGVSLRQLPVPGLHTKWAEKRRAVVSDFLRAVRGEGAAADFYALCGLRPPPTRLRMRVLCPSLRRALGGLCDLEAPLSELASLSLEPRGVIIVENLETGLALPDLDGWVAFMGLGNAASLLAELDWLRGVAIVYWGDLDTHGLAILARARAALGDVRSLLMDEGTLLAHRSLWSEELVPCSERDLPNLTAEERTVWEGLHSQRWGARVRLEQERIPWEHGVASLRDALDEAAQRADRGRQNEARPLQLSEPQRESSTSEPHEVLSRQG